MAPMPMKAMRVKYVVSCFPPTDMLEAVDAFDDETNPFRLYYFGPFAAWWVRPMRPASMPRSVSVR